MDELQFNGIHFAITLGAIVVGFSMGIVYGYLLKDEKDRRKSDGRVAQGTEE